ncbi:MAG: NFACT family protein [Eubacteriales bacterium]|nr:NFACT family protein [Eubacteriales bacterium]
MHLDGFFFNSLVREIQQKIAGSRVEDVYDSVEGNLILQLRAPGQTLRLEISIPPLAFFLTEGGRRRKNPGAFSQTLKKHMASLFCRSFTNPPFDRRATLALAPSPDGQASHFLHIEIMGRQNDIIFCDQDIIIASTRPPKPGAARLLQPGDRYSPPLMPAKTAPVSLTGPLLGLLLANLGQVSSEQALVKTILGVSPLLAREICLRAGVANTRAADLNSQALDLLAGEIVNLSGASLQGNSQPVLYAEQGPYWTRLTHLSPPRRQYPTLSAALADWMANSRGAGQFESLYQRLQSAIATSLKRLQGTIAKQKIELNRAQEFEDFRQTADTLLACLNAVPKGAAAVTLANIYTGKLQQISLDPSLAATANAARYYKKYNKYKNAAVKVQKQIDANHNLLVYLQSLEYALEAANSLDDLREVLAEAEEAGLIRRQHKVKAPAAPSETYMIFRTDRGNTVLAGKNNRQNERLTLQKADKNHYWLHCRHSPGSHVILCTNEPEASELAYAASLAAWHSKERTSPKVEVVWTQVKNVKKIPGAKPGMVQYVNYRSIFIEPSPH